jgi:hypothetical protein
VSLERPKFACSKKQKSKAVTRVRLELAGSVECDFFLVDGQMVCVGHTVDSTTYQELSHYK